MADITLTDDDAIGFSWRVDSAIRSDDSSNLGVYSFHGFDSIVDSAIRSGSPDLSLPHSHHDYDYSGSDVRTEPETEGPSSGLNQSSFRVKGIDGEFDRIFRSLGLSGPEDNAIWSSPDSSFTTSPVRTFAFPFIRDPLPHSHHGYDYSDSDVRTEPETEEPSSGLVNGKRTFRSWQKVELIGKGSFSTVYEGIADSGFIFAVKEVSLLDNGVHGRESIRQLQQEISLLSQFQHDNIVGYFGAEKDNDKLYMFVELITNGSLTSLYQNYGLTDSQVSEYTWQILCGLMFLHDHNVVHRDIKCANIFVDENSIVKLSNFGMAKVIKSNDVKSIKGSTFWMAPEVVNLRGYELAADIWSLGCTVLEMLTRQPPYSHLEGVQALFQIGRGQPPLVPDSLSTDARDFIHKCLKVNPYERPTAAQLLDHPFVKKQPLYDKSFFSEY